MIYELTKIIGFAMAVSRLRVAALGVFPLAVAGVSALLSKSPFFARHFTKGALESAGTHACPIHRIAHASILAHRTLFVAVGTKIQPSAGDFAGHASPS